MLFRLHQTYLLKFQMVLRKPHYKGMRSMETVWFYNTKVDSELERRKGLPKVKKPMRMLTPVRVLEPIPQFYFQVT